MDDIDIIVSFKGQQYTSASQAFEALSEDIQTALRAPDEGVSQTLRDYLTQVTEAVVARNSGRWPGGTTARSLSVRSGELNNAILKSVRIEGTSISDLVGAIGGNWLVAVHEFGTTIRGHGKMLTVPLPAALDPRGIPLKAKARDWPNTFVTKTRRGNLIIFQRRGAEIIPLYVLKETVRIPPRLGLQEEMRAQLPYFTEKVLDRIMQVVESRI